jgi:hypothetical protein
MKALAYWPFGIAVAWAATLALTISRYGAPPAVQVLAVVGMLLVVPVAAANARWVRRHRSSVYLTPELLAVVSRRPLVPRQPLR